METQDRIQQVKDYFFNLVPELDDEKWKSFEDIVAFRQFKKGDVIMRPGMICDHVSFVNYGLLRNYYLVDGKEFIVNFVGENCYFSDYESFLSRMPSKMYADALEETEVVEMSYDNLQALYRKYPECERAGRFVAEGLYMLLSEKSASFLLQTPEQRYQKFLENYAHVSSRVPQYMIASYLGVTPEALSRIRGRMSRQHAPAN